MSESGKNRSDIGGGSGCENNDGDNEENRRGGGGGIIRVDGRNEQKRKGRGDGSRDVCTAKNRLLRGRRRRNKGPSSSSSSFCGSYLCFRRPRTSGSPADSPTSDPNNPEFSYELLKALIENNDFYSGECNPHISEMQLMPTSSKN